MTNNEAIEIIANFDKHIIPCDEYGYRIDSDLMEAHLMAAKALRNGWIPMAQKKPEDDIPSSRKQVKVMTAIKQSNGTYIVRSQMRFKDTWYDRWCWKYSSGKVTHWMPLPESPKEVDNA